MSAEKWESGASFQKARCFVRNPIDAQQQDHSGAKQRSMVAITR